jgi:hypothetical protein
MSNLIVAVLPWAALLGPIVVVAAWWLMAEDAGARRRFLALWLGAVLLQAAAGALVGYLDPSTTMAGTALTLSGTSWLLGPVLACFFGPRRSLLAGAALSLIAPVMGGIAGLFIAIITGAVRVCG